MPSDLHLSAYCDYIQILGELEVFISVHNFDINVIVGDFNVDFDRDVRLTDLLRVFVFDPDLSVCDLQFRDNIHYTYERDDGLVRSWIDHILCSRVKEFNISNIYRLDYGSTFSAHYPLFSLWTLAVHQCLLHQHLIYRSLIVISLMPQNLTLRIIVLLYIIVILVCPPLLLTVVILIVLSTVTYYIYIDEYALWFMQCLLDCALLWIPLRNSGGKRSISRWNDGTQTLKVDANFWYRVWSEAGCPCSSMLYARFGGRKDSSLGVNFFHTACSLAF